MTGISQPISIGTQDPEYYAELFCKISRPADWRLPSDERPCPDVPGIQNVDDPLARRLQTLLDAVADISLCRLGNVTATMACLKDNHGTLETELYIVFNHEDDEAAGSCSQHLQVIFDMLRQVPYRPPEVDGSPKVIANELQHDFIKLCTAIHNYSFDIFAHRVTKREHKLSEIRGYIEMDQKDFSPQQREMLLAFLDDVDSIILSVANAQTTKQLPTFSIEMLLKINSYWTKHNLLPKDLDRKLTLLDRADLWLEDNYKIGFKLGRWALKIMSFLISANRLFILTQSHRLRKLIQGKLEVQVLNSPPTAPYCCVLSPETVQGALNDALAGSRYLSTDWDRERESFIERLLKKLGDPEVVRWKPTVHAELAMIMAMVEGQIEGIFPYIGVSKLSCIMCSHYIRAFNEVRVTEQKIATKGSHGKAYPGWSWPSLPHRDGEVQAAFLGRIRQQLLSDFEHHAETWRRLSDSSVGSGGPEWDMDTTRDEIKRLDALHRKQL